MTQEISAKVRERVDDYVTSALVFASIMATALALPVLPLGGNLVLPVVVAVISTVLNLRGRKEVVKVILTYYLVLTLTVQSFFSFAPLIPRYPELYLGQLAFLLILAFVVAPIVAKWASPFSIALGLLVGTGLVYPDSLPLALAGLVLAVVYSRDVGRAGQVILISVLLIEPFITAATASNGLGNMAFEALKLDYVTLNFYNTSSGTSLQGIQGSASFHPVNGTFVRSSLQYPVYLFGGARDLDTEFLTIASTFRVLGNEVSLSPGVLGRGLAELVGFFYVAIAVGAVLAVASILSVEGVRTLSRLYSKVEGTSLGGYLAIAEPAIYSSLFSLLLIYLVSQMSIPLDYLTSVGFNYPFLLGTFGTSALGGGAISVREWYVSRKAEEMRLRRRIMELAEEFRRRKAKVLASLEALRETVKERDFPYSNLFRNLGEEVEREVEGVERVGLEVLRSRLRRVEELTREAEQLRRNMEYEVLNFVRSRVLRYNALASEAERLTGLSVQRLSENPFDSLDRVIQNYGSAYAVYRDLSTKLTEVYESLNRALSRLMPKDVARVESPPPSDSLEGLENLVNSYLKPMLEGVAEEEFSKYVGEFSKLTGIPPNFTIREADKFLTELQRWIESEVGKLDGMLAQVRELETIASNLLSFGQNYTPMRSTSSVAPEIEDFTKRLRNWADLEELSETLREYREYLLPKLQEALKSDQLQIEVTSTFKAVERYLLDQLGNREAIEVENVPLSREAAITSLQLFVNSHPHEYSLEVKERALGRREVRVRRRA